MQNFQGIGFTKISAASAAVDNIQYCMTIQKDMTQNLLYPHMTRKRKGIKLKHNKKTALLQLNRAISRVI